MASTDVFKTGKYEVTTIPVTTSHPTQPPPTELFILAPLTQGTYPVLLFCHGYMLRNIWYTDLLTHIASHGYIVVAPMFYVVASFSCVDEVRKAAEVTEWLSTGLPAVLPKKVNGDIDNLALSGHSRGGKSAFALALGKFDGKASVTVRDDTTVPPPKFKALIGIDPVEGPILLPPPPPKILEHIPHCLNLSMPVAVIGSGLGNQWQGFIAPWAPDGLNHAEFFNECKTPACYFLAKEYGHVDILDDNWITDDLRWICKCGKGSKQPVRNGVGGIVVAFLRYYLGHDQEADLNLIVDNPAVAPILLDPVVFHK